MDNAIPKDTTNQIATDEENLLKETLTEVTSTLEAGEKKREDTNQVSPQVVKIDSQNDIEEREITHNPTLTTRLSEQLKQWGVSTVTSLLALLLAVITPIILNSQFIQDVTATINEIRSKLPTEADAILVSQLSTLSQENQNMLTDLTQQQLLLKHQDDEFKDSRNTTKQQYDELMKTVVELNLKNKLVEDVGQTLKSKVTEMETELSELQKSLASAKTSANQRLYQQLQNLHVEGKKLSEQQARQAEQWFKKVFYIVKGLQREGINNQLSEHAEVLKKISDKTGDFRDFASRKDEALLILSSLSILAKASVIN